MAAIERTLEDWRKLVAEFDARADVPAKAWLTQNKVHSGQLYTFRKRFAAEQKPVTKRGGKPGVRRRTWTDDKKEALIRSWQADGETLPMKQRGQWYKEHGVHMTWFRKMMRDYLASHPDFNRPQPAPAPKRLGRPPKNTAHLRELRSAALSIDPAPPKESLTLADAIMAMKVKRDQLNSFIEELERMQGGLQ